MGTSQKDLSGSIRAYRMTPFSREQRMFGFQRSKFTIRQGTLFNTSLWSRSPATIFSVFRAFLFLFGICQKILDHRMKRIVPTIIKPGLDISESIGIDFVRLHGHSGKNPNGFRFFFRRKVRLVHGFSGDLFHDEIV